jgi:hypothetical protein
MLPIQINGASITTAEEAAAGLKQLFTENKTRDAVEAMEWLAGDNTLRQALRDPALIMQLARAAKDELVGNPKAAPDHNILRLMHGAPGFMDNLREDAAFIARVGDAGWGALAGTYHHENEARQNYNHLRQVAGLVIDVDAATAAATTPERLQIFAKQAGEELDQPLLKDRMPGVAALREENPYRRWHERAGSASHLAAYIGLANAHPFLAPALNDEALVQKISARATELMKHQPALLGDLGILAETVASAPALDAALRSVEGVEAALENVITIPSLPDNYGAVALMRDAEGNTRMSADMHENQKPDRAFSDSFTGFHVMSRSPDFSAAGKVIALVEKAREKGWAVDGDIAAIVHDVEYMGSESRHVARQHYAAYRALVPNDWHGIAVLTLAKQNEALQKSARPGPAAGKSLIARLTRT